MKQLLKTVWIVVILCSCRQDNKPLKQNTDTIKAVDFEINKKAHAPLSAKQVISNTEGCSYSNLTNSLGEGLVIVPNTFEVFNDSLCLDR
jgi:hypothetical protein